MVPQYAIYFQFLLGLIKRSRGLTLVWSSSLLSIPSRINLLPFILALVL
ncbi:hypothetical protein J5U22_01657 [Saccharolobus shibatae]|uniref:Uncharacterized protein n=1 Tax=Saccharolobus shibatae TaxID=2286 RepID=A0A8F5C170_9CREN|nr:hypothetical protein J5U22_01657 [Saccharolobus shibatae]